MQAALDHGWPLAILIQIHQKAGHFGEGSTSTSSHMNQSMEQENEDQEDRMMEECGDSSDDEDYPLLGEW